MRVGRGRDTHAELGAALGHAAALLVVAVARLAVKAVLVDLDQLVATLGLEQHLVELELHRGTAHVPQHKDLLLRKGAQIHLGRLEDGRAVGKILAVHARHQVVELLGRERKKRVIEPVGLPGDVLGDVDALPKKLARE